MDYRASQASKQSFFEKKDQKAFAPAPARAATPLLQAGALARRKYAFVQARRQKLFGPFSRKRTACFLVFLLLFHPTMSQAHAFLESARPRVGSTIPSAPAEIVLSFTQGVEQAFSKIAVTDVAGTHEEVGAVHNVEADREKLAVSVGKLGPGTYTVSWHVTAVDTHKTQGKFLFTVAP